MPKRTRSHLPATKAAVTALGAQIAAARRGLGWSAAELAQRVGVGAAVISHIENGRPTVAIGTVFEAAVLCGVPLFGVDRDDLGRVAEVTRARLALLPASVRSPRAEIDDDF